jgi:hypothetical protein
MTRLQPIAALRPAPDTHTARKAQPIAPEIVELAPTPPSTDFVPCPEGAHTQREDIPTQLAIGSDGRLYITADQLPEPIRRGRRVFTGVALTPEEAAFATKIIEDASSEIAQTVWQMLVIRNPAQ